MNVFRKKINKKIFILVLCAMLAVSTAAVAAGEVIKWNEARAAGPENVTFSQIVNGGGHTLALDATGKNVYGWGDNTYGQVGGLSASSDLTAATVAVPRLVFQATGAQVVSKIVATEDSSALLLKSSASASYGTVYTWGAGSTAHYFQNGTAEATIYTPTKLSDSRMSTVKDLAAGQRHYACLLDGDKVLTWGDNRNGQVAGKANGVSCYAIGTDHKVDVRYNVNGSDKEVDLMSTAGMLIMGVAAGYNNTYLRATTAGAEFHFILGENFNKAYDAGDNANALSVGRDLSSMPKTVFAGDVAVARDGLYYVSGGALYRLGFQSSASAVETELMSGNVKQVVTTGLESGTGAWSTAVLTTDNKVKVFGKAASASQAVWGTATLDSIDASAAEEVSFQLPAGGSIRYLTGGLAAIQAVDSTGRAHIFGDAAQHPAKFPAITGAAVDTASALPKLYNLSSFARYVNYDAPAGSKYFANDKFYMLADPTGFDLTKYECLDHGEVSFSLSAEKLVASTGQTYFTENDNVAFVTADAAGDSALSTRYGKVNVYQPYIEKEDGTKEPASFLSFDPSDPTVLKVNGQQARTDDEYTVRLYLKEYANGDTDEIVGIVSFTITFCYGDWKPIVKTAEMDPALDIEFKADANANVKESGENRPVVFDPNDADKIYKQKTFKASDLVSDPDDAASTLTFSENSEEFNVSGMENYFSVAYDEKRLNITITAKASVTSGQFKVTVEDASGGTAVVTIDMTITAKASEVVNVDISSLATTTGALTMKISDLYDDSASLKFRSGAEANTGVTVLVAGDGKSFTARSVNPGVTKVYVKVGETADMDGERDITLEFSIDFPVNAAPTIRPAFKKTISLFLGSVYYTVYDIFDDVNAAIVLGENGHYVVDEDAGGDELQLVIMSGGSKGIFKASPADNFTRLNIEPERNGTDKLFVRVSDKAGNAAVYALTFTVQNQFATPAIALGMERSTLDAGYLASFLYNLPLTADQRSEAVIVAEENVSPVVSGGVTCVLSGDGKQLTVTPVSAGNATIRIKLQVMLDNTKQTVEMTVKLFVTSQFSENPIRIDTKAGLSGGVYKLTVEELISSMGLVSANGTPLIASQFTYKAVYLKGSEEHATASVNPIDNKVLDIKPLSNTEEGDPEYIKVILASSAVEGEEYGVLIPVAVENLKLYPTDSEYQMILWFSLGGAGIVIAILVLISFGVNTHRRHEYEAAIEKAKARDRMKKAQALGGTKEQVLKRGMGQNVKITPSQQRPMGMVPPMAGPMGMNNPYMRPSQAPLGLGSSMSMAQPGMSMAQPGMSMTPPVGGSIPRQSVQQGATSWQTGQSPAPPQQAPVRENKSQNGKSKRKRNSSMLALETSEQDDSNSLPPLKAQNNVPKNARDEIENKIQARIAQENALREQEMLKQQEKDGKKKKKGAADEDDGPKMTKAERKKQEMLEKLRAKMLADREKGKK